MEYILETHNAGQLKVLYPQTFPYARYLYDKGLKAYMEKRLVFVGKCNEVLFVDITVFHRGGNLQTGERKMIHFFLTLLFAHIPVQFLFNI
jgi:hypothetical protein